MKIKTEFKGQVEFRRQLLKFASSMNITIKEAIILKSSQTARALANQSEPFGLGAKAKKISEGAIAGDFHKVYLSKFHIHHLMRSKSRRKGAAYMQAIMDNRWNEAERLATSTLGHNVVLGQPANIQNRRNYKGRVEQARKSVIVENYDEALSYKAKLMENIAMSKGAWLSISQELKKKGARKPAKWLRKSAKYSSSRIEGDHLGSSVTMRNNIKYAGRILKRAKIEKALKADEKAFTKRMDKTITAANAKK